MKEDFESILQNSTKEEILAGVRSLYNSDKKDFYDIINILDTLKAGDKRKLEIGRLCKIYQGDIPTEDLKQIFPFDFFVEIEKFHDDEIGVKSFNMIRKNIQTIFESRDNEYIRSMATFIGSILEGNIFIDEVYIDTLVSIGERYTFRP